MEYDRTLSPYANAQRGVAAVHAEAAKPPTFTTVDDAIAHLSAIGKAAYQDQGGGILKMQREQIGNVTDANIGAIMAMYYGIIRDTPSIHPHFAMHRVIMRYAEWSATR